MDYATNFTQLLSDNDLQFATKNYMKCARMLNFISIEILKEFVYKIEILKVKMDDIYDDSETLPYTENNCLYDMCYNEGYMSVLQGLKRMIEPALEQFDVIRKNGCLIVNDTDLCLLPDFDNNDNLFEKIKKTYKAIFFNEYENFSSPEFLSNLDWENIYILVTGQSFKILHDLISELENSMYIPF